MTDSVHNFILGQYSNIQLADDQFAPAPIAGQSVHLLGYRSFIRIQGPDSAKFLQGQLSCDVNAVTTHNASRGSHCTPKGRAIATFTLAQHQPDNYLFCLPRNNQQALQQSLSKYIVFSKAKLSEENQLLCLGLCGDNSHAFVEQLIGKFDGGNFISNEQAMAYAIDHKRIELWLNEQQFATLWPLIGEQFTPSDNQPWLNAQIAAAIVEVEATTSDEFVPQMIGLKENDGISYKKGCYTGQEIVARLHFLGKQKRQLYRFEHSQAALNIGAKIQTPEGKDIGTVVGLSQTQALAVLSSDEATTNVVFEGVNHLASRCHQDHSE